MGQLLLRKYFCMLSNKLGLAPRALSSFSKRLVVIDYHYFTSKDLIYPDLEVSYESLEAQLEIISRNCRLRPPVETLEDLFSGRMKSEEQSLVITIDDADKSLLDALNFFHEFKIPFVLFAPVGLCLSENELDGVRSRCLSMYKYLSLPDLPEPYSLLTNADKYFDFIINSSFIDLEKFYKLIRPIQRERSIILERNLLTIQQLKDIIETNKIIISSHTMSHSILSELPSDWMKWEISRSLEIIRQIGGDTRLFAYPYGYKKSYDKNVKNTLENAGVKYAFMTTSSLTKQNSDHLAIGRASMLNYKESSFVLGTVSGAFRIWDKLLLR